MMDLICDLKTLEEACLNFKENMESEEKADEDETEEIKEIEEISDIQGEIKDEEKVKK